MSELVLLGPQRFRPTLLPTLRSLDIEGPVAVVTAGWQEREEEIDALRKHVRSETIHLRLYQRAEKLLQRDTELADALRERQDRLRNQQELYRLRLDHALEAVRRLMERHDGGALLVEHRRAAIRVLKTLDRQNLVRIRAIHRAFDEQWQPAARPETQRHVEELREQLRPSKVLAIAGGHVAVLLNRLRLFDLPSMIGRRPVIAWSAGAMALGERVLLFHDHPPQGAGNPEIFESGFELHRKLVPLPLARQRLRLEDPLRVAVLARRMHPAVCVPLDDGDRIDWNGSAWRPAPGTRRLSLRGNVRRFGAGKSR